MVLSDPLLSIGSYSIYPFGSLLAAAFLLGAFLFWRSARQEGFASDAVFDLIFLPSLVALFFGRLSFLLLTGEAVDFVAILQVGRGIFWAPAFLAGLGVFYFYTMRRRGWSFLKLADLAVPALALGEGIVLLAAQLTGYLSSVALAGIGYLLLFAILTLLKKKFITNGVNFLIYLLLSGALTLLLEGQRAAKTPVFLGGNINLNHFFGALLLASGGLGLLYLFAYRGGVLTTIRKRVTALLPLAKLEKQLRFKLKGKRRFVRFWFDRVTRQERVENDGTEKEPSSS